MKREDCKGLLQVKKMLETSLTNANFFRISCQALEKNYKGQQEYVKKKLKTINKILEDPKQRARWEELLNMSGFGEKEK